MKRNCNNCRALSGSTCLLGKSINFDLMDAIVRGYKIYKPTEDCPKPKTYKKLMNFLNV